MRSPTRSLTDLHDAAHTHTHRGRGGRDGDGAAGLIRGGAATAEGGGGGECGWVVVDRRTTAVRLLEGGEHERRVRTRGAADMILTAPIPTD